VIERIEDISLAVSTAESAVRGSALSHETYLAHDESWSKITMYKVSASARSVQSCNGALHYCETTWRA